MLIIKIYVKSTLALIIYSENILNTLALSQITNINKIAKRNFLGFQALAVLNSVLPDNLLIYNQSNVKALWAYL